MSQTKSTTMSESLDIAQKEMLLLWLGEDLSIGETGLKMLTTNLFHTQSARTAISILDSIMLTKL